MTASNSGGGGPLSAEAAAALGVGISLVFGRWMALQMVVGNQSGGRDSRARPTSSARPSSLGSATSRVSTAPSSTSSNNRLGFELELESGSNVGNSRTLIVGEGSTSWVSFLGSKDSSYLD
jgi:hypothetical protein